MFAGGWLVMEGKWGMEVFYALSHNSYMGHERGVEGAQKQGHAFKVL